MGECEIVQLVALGRQHFNLTVYGSISIFQLHGEREQQRHDRLRWSGDVLPLGAVDRRSRMENEIANTFASCCRLRWTRDSTARLLRDFQGTMTSIEAPLVVRLDEARVYCTPKTTKNTTFRIRNNCDPPCELCRQTMFCIVVRINAKSERLFWLDSFSLSTCRP